MAEGSEELSFGDPIIDDLMLRPDEGHEPSARKINGSKDDAAEDAGKSYSLKPSFSFIVREPNGQRSVQAENKGRDCECHGEKGRKKEGFDPGRANFGRMDGNSRFGADRIIGRRGDIFPVLDEGQFLEIRGLNGRVGAHGGDGGGGMRVCGLRWGVKNCCQGICKCAAQRSPLQAPGDLSRSDQHQFPPLGILMMNTGIEPLPVRG